MKNAAKPLRSSEFDLQKVNEEFRLYRTSDASAVYINESAAMVWQLCDGNMRVNEIKRLLKDSYDGADSDIDKDVDATLESLAAHGAIGA